ncbi:MAG TPA: proline--tRNA ligase [Desulfofustis sp.]|jgi:prolyl-tRNA synthetase|nr:proline--tRNA ligase [Desulfofustis sp. PB-SRB1]HBH30036.1 proline--tRNA ligase [Desulfofustis sp.]
MRYTNLFVPTLKESPAEAEVISHQLMLRAGFIRKLTSGIYTYLPYGLAAIRRVESIVREEMNRAGAQEILMPMVQPADLWRESGRYLKYGPELLRFTDRHERESCLGPTHEEVITDIARREIHSYRDLPVNLYQIQTKFRDEIRPRFGLMRGREFIMKDAYSFDIDDKAAEQSYRAMHDAYTRIFSRCGLDFRCVEADSGAIGGSFSHEFMVLAETGEDTIAVCTACSWAANLEKAAVLPPRQKNIAAMLPLGEVETVGKKKVATVCEFLGIPTTALAKTIVFTADGVAVALLIRADREVELVKIKNYLGVQELRVAEEKEIFDAVGVAVGYLGPVALPIRLLVDQEITGMANFTTGANRKNYHLVNVNPNRDVLLKEVGDFRRIDGDDPCPSCGGPLQLIQGIEVGHIFKLGTAYSETLKAYYQDQNGNEKPLVMGCYGIGVSRVVAAAIEQNHDKNGIIFPVPLAPYQVVVLNLATDDDELTAVAETIYADLQAAGIETLLDDRGERPGVKFKDADLLGFPYRVTVGKRFREHGMAEVVRRRDGRSEACAPAELAGFLGDRLSGGSD